MNSHWKGRLSPRLRVSSFSPKVLIGVLFAAYRKFRRSGLQRWLRVGGITEISAPVSTRNLKLDVLSVINRRRFVAKSLSATATCDRGFSFPNSVCTGVGISALRLHMFHGTSISLIDACRDRCEWILSVFELLIDYARVGCLARMI